MQVDKAHVGDIAIKLKLNVEADITGSTDRKIYYNAPDGGSGYWSATQESTTSISYTTTQASDLDSAGWWKLQSCVTTSSWGPIRGEVTKLYVEEAI